MKSRLTTILLVGSTLTLLSACAAYPTTESEFGDSVRQMVRSQKVFAAVDEAPVQTGDGQRLEAVLEGYRENAPAADTASNQSIQISTTQ